MNRPALFVEPCAGAAAVTLRLLGGPRLTPPVAWMGGKRRQAAHILAMFGLRSGLGAERVLLSDPGPWGWVWPVLLQPKTCRLVAEHIRLWAGEEPRALWDRLKAAGPAEDLVERAAGWLWLQGRAAGGVPVWWPDESSDYMMSDGSGVARSASHKGAHRLLTTDHHRQRAMVAGQTGVDRRRLLVMGDAGGGVRGSCQTGHGGGRLKGLLSPERLADRLAAVELVATWCCLQAGAAKGKPVSIGANGWTTPGYARSDESERTQGTCWSPGSLADNVVGVSRLRTAATVYHGSALDLVPDGDHTGTYVYMDPPYQGKTGYGWAMPREQVVELARTWADAGAWVMVSEAEPLAELEALGWESQEITAIGRKGSGAEWVTSSRPVRARVSVQVPLWEVA